MVKGIARWSREQPITSHVANGQQVGQVGSQVVRSRQVVKGIAILSKRQPGGQILTRWSRNSQVVSEVILVIKEQSGRQEVTRQSRRSPGGNGGSQMVTRIAIWSRGSKRQLGVQRVARWSSWQSDSQGGNQVVKEAKQSWGQQVGQGVARWSRGQRGGQEGSHVVTVRTRWSRVTWTDCVPWVMNINIFKPRALAVMSSSNQNIVLLFNVQQNLFVRLEL